MNVILLGTLTALFILFAILYAKKVRGKTGEKKSHNSTEKNTKTNVCIPEAVKGASEVKLCKECSTANESLFIFCRECGSRLTHRTVSVDELENGTVHVE